MKTPGAVMRAAIAALAVVLGAWAPAAAWARVPVPPVPSRWFTDSTATVPGNRAAAIDARLERFERETSIQFLVVLLPGLGDRDVIEEWTIRTAREWRVGRRELDNGLVLFIFPGERKLRFEVGRGLEGAIPDATAATIIRTVMVPLLRQGDTAGAIEAAIEAVEKATRGEFKAPAEAAAGAATGVSPLSILVLFIVIAVWIALARRGIVIVPMGGGGVTFGGGGSRSGGWGGGGGFGGGGFSGGGGSFGGGGASGSW